jgi:hypothetical protein
VVWQCKIGALVGVVWLIAAEPLMPQSLWQAEPAAGVRFAGANLPSPPQQGQAWNAPKGRLPDKWGTAVAELRGQGLSDPRGCEYREVKITWIGRSALTFAATT